MAKREDIYGEVNNAADLDKIYGDIRDRVAGANSRDDLTHLYRQAEYLVTLTFAPSWHDKFGDKVDALRKEAERDFSQTAQAINTRAQQIGTAADYDEKYGDGSR